MLGGVEDAIFCFFAYAVVTERTCFLSSSSSSRPGAERRCLVQCNPIELFCRRLSCGGSSWPAGDVVPKTSKTLEYSLHNFFNLPCEQGQMNTSSNIETHSVSPPMMLLDFPRRNVFSFWCLLCLKKVCREGGRAVE